VSIFRPEPFKGQCTEIVVPKNISPREAVRCSRMGLIDGLCKQHHAAHRKPGKKTDKERIAELETHAKDLEQQLDIEVAGGLSLRARIRELEDSELDSEKRIALLETAIRKHRHQKWGCYTPAFGADKSLYDVLQEQEK